ERPWNRQPLFNKLNRNKQSVAIDLKTTAGHDAFLALVRESDVVIENFSARAMPGLGLGYEALRAVKPDVIYIGMPSFGMDGPYRDYVGLGPSIEPTTGLTALMGYGPHEPRVTAKAISDAIGGTNAAVAVLVALARRARTGEGASIDLSQQECGIAFLGEHVIERQLSGHEPERRGNAHRTYAPHGVYRCAGADEWIAIAARDDAEWAALDTASGRGWAADPRFATLEARRAHGVELDAAIEQWTCAEDKRALMSALQARGVPAGAVLATPEWTSDPHLVERGYFAELLHPEAGAERWDGSPVRFDGRRGYDRWLPAPLLGGDNDAVLRKVAGFTTEYIRQLAASGVIADRPPT
ncbi:MAG: CoA transferase, partial [Chloroflexi bacterium]|nr:CoA transferase [Chloroflexota bacterium]